MNDDVLSRYNPICNDIDSDYIREYLSRNPIPMPEAPTFAKIELPTPEDRLKPLTDRMDSMQNELETQTSELVKLRYENAKLNAQITTQNKVIDKQLSELEELQSINSKIDMSNKVLISNNRHYWRNTALIGLGLAIFGAVLGIILS